MPVLLLSHQQLLPPATSMGPTSCSPNDKSNCHVLQLCIHLTAELTRHEQVNSGCHLVQANRPGMQDVAAGQELQACVSVVTASLRPDG